jgi:2-polyprenyl-3-methyl-5-hydroxy-6-metoxy-1,4-benzoquinol methylase
MLAVDPAPLPGPKLTPTECPICGTSQHDREVYRANFDPAALDAQIFSARRLPDRLHYRMVRCGSCGLLRSNPILSTSDLSRLYGASHFTYAAESQYTRRTYARYLKVALRYAPAARSAMEVGCGSGFFLEEALGLGLSEVHGIEPSSEAIAHAVPAVRANLRQGLYGEQTFAPSSFDVVCAFQVFDHVPDPAGMLRACHRHLKRGGIALFINHDSGALTNRILGRRSPIVDVEHTALYDRKTMRRILEKTGFTVREIFSVQNTYPLSYWAKLAPLPKALKSPLLSWLDRSPVGRIAITLSAGNLGAIAVKE